MGKIWHKIVSGTEVFFREPLIVGDRSVYNPSDAIMEQEGWSEYIEPEPTLAEVKEAKIAEIDAYDTSEAVNEFFIGNQSLWLDKATRTGLNFSLAMEAQAGHTESTLWYGVLSYTLPITTLQQMLAALELYAKECYNVTAGHKRAVLELETKEAVQAYDHTADYPTKLTFEL